MPAHWMAPGLAEARTRNRPATRHPIGATPRATAARALHAVRGQGQSLTRVLETSGIGDPNPADRALTHEMVYGSVRTLPQLEALVARLLKHPVKPGDQILECLILVGLYQLIAMDTPAHAAVAATVEASRLIGKPHQAALVNALLRRFLREREPLLAAVAREPAVQWLFPEWLLARLRQDWPEHWQELVRISNGRAPMSLRVNPLRTDREAYQALLATAGLPAHPIPDCPQGLTLARPCPTSALPGFDRGLVSVQDGGAQRAAELLDAAPGTRVLDACAAPGGKAASILERAANRLELVAIDHSPQRLQSLHDTFSRLGLRAEVILADAAQPEGDWAAPPFERILLDVPCSATGVIRRHPDIKWLRRDADIAALSALQDQILRATWPLLAPGGRLLYTTCSLLAHENEARVSAFLAAHTDARERPIHASWGIARTVGRQLLPAAGANDGFYFALIDKVAS
ncbi:16S rRNA (cytosine(967)-C(5))-methyltransferase [Thiocapsa imhoffii]|uniref:16S rRNA (cytosine(967)-C(5))-methyltransferase n=1 Tax=Thiocapsa imhoffii TaxID=382777 RepID=A0A9X0WKP5_9GAMM|nr:16S rRNA (cytosine(967)-C(5))-methyltransferase RsmB [Thiocapsa imhoffii]MBK1645907.1 16S rRNA (cytosine(967)-C(5))-methyltransferase [Thiocapsa imhoffii]